MLEQALPTLLPTNPFDERWILRPYWLQLIRESRDLAWLQLPLASAPAPARDLLLLDALILALTEPRSSWLPFKPAEVVKLLADAVKSGDGELADLIRLGMWTGARIEELCALKIEKVKRDHFSVEDAKTAAGWRDVPIHPKLAPTMKRLIGKRKEGYVLANLKANKYGDRSNAIGKRFGRLKKAKGFGDQFVFHSIRKTVVTQLEEAGVPESTVADIIGHEHKTLTFGLYSGGVSLDVKREALAKLAY